MDRVTALVALARLKLRLELLPAQSATVGGYRHEPHIKRPFELAGFPGGLTRAEKTESDLAVRARAL
ncbi:hypothetical protein [Bradyrhizobium sp. WSM1417]|uniref:hypothetical protein n=1 Tax=Bradyrhizobium sp. WSM1417 TaxID=754500 RepID=UPI0004818168|nr:hypothetical protein [Bradyrhizobium sp. WSM1417]